MFCYFQKIIDGQYIIKLLKYIFYRNFILMILQFLVLSFVYECNATPLHHYIIL